MRNRGVDSNSRPPAAAAASSTAVPPVKKSASAGGQWIARVKSASSADFPALLSDLPAEFSESQESWSAAVRFLFGQWLARDADAALAFAAQQEDEPRLPSLAMEVMARAWPEKALALMSGIEPGVRDAAVQGLVQFHPEAYLKLDPDGKGDSYYWREAVKSLAGRNAAAAMEAWSRRNIPEEEKRNSDHLAFVIGKSWAEQDPANARRWADSLPPGDARRMALHACLSVLAHQDPLAALKALPPVEELGADDIETTRPGDSPDAHYCGDAREEIAEHLAKRDFPAAMAAVRELALRFPREENDDDTPPGEPAGWALRRLQRAMIRSKIDALPAGPAAIAEMETVCALMAPLKLKGAYNPKWEDEIRGNVILTLSAEESLATAVQRMDAGIAADNQVSLELLDHAADYNPADVIALLPKLPGEARARMAAVIYAKLPADAAELHALLAPHIDPGALRWDSDRYGKVAEYAPSVAGLDADQRGAFAATWSSKNPGEAAAWVATLPNGSSEAQGLARRWAGYDDTSAIAWASSLAAGPVRDGAATGLAAALTATNPEAAWDWAASISNGWDRAQALLDLGGQWKDAPPEFRADLAAACAAEGLIVEDSQEGTNKSTGSP